MQCVLTLRSAGETVYSDVALLLIRGQSVFASEQQILRVSYRFFTGPEVRECNNWFSGSFLLLSVLPEHNISWYINGSELVQSTSSAVSLLSETTVEVTAHPEFNTTAVYCRLNGTSITSPTAVLLIQGRERFYTNTHM